MAETSFQGTPEWYGGGKGILKDLVERAESESRSKYQPYKGNRVSPFTPLQDQSFDIARREAQNPLYKNIYGEARENINGALGRNVAPAIAPFLQQATRSINNQDLNQFMNPYDERVVNQIATLGNRNLQENILPNVQNRFIGAGQYGSTGHQNFTNRAVRDTQEGISQAQGKALQGGFNTALQALQNQKGRQLEAGQITGNAMSRDVDRQLAGGEALQNLASNQQNQGLRNSAVLNQLGGQQQQQGQNELNTAFQEFQRERDFPYFQSARLNEIVRGLPVNSQQFNNNFTPQPPQASPWSQGAGLVSGAAAALNQNPQGGGQRYAQGGHVKNATRHYRHYADGGSLNPIQEGANHAIDTAELKELRGHADRLQQPTSDPFWSAVSRAGFNLAANTRPNALANLGQAAGEGLTEYQNQLNNQDSRRLESSKILQMIDNTKRLQAENNRTHQRKMDEFGEKKRQFGLSHGVQAGALGLEREKFEHTKQHEQGDFASPYGGEYGKVRLKEEAKVDVKRSEDIKNSSEKAYGEIQRIDQILNSLKDAKVGPGFEGRKYISSAAQAMGIDIPELGDPSSMLEVKKGLLQLARETTNNSGVKASAFNLQSAIEGLPQTSDSPEAVTDVLMRMKIFKEYEARQGYFKEDWESNYGSIRRKAPNGLSYDQAYKKFADKYIWSKLKKKK